MDINKEIRYTVFCNDCGNYETYEELGDNPKKVDAQRYFGKNGWRVIDNETLCSECIYRRKVKPN